MPSANLPPTITLEEHWCSQHVRDLYKIKGKEDPNDESGVLGFVTETLMELGPQRLQAMDDHGVSLQVISHVANIIAIGSATCRKVNDELADLIKSQPEGRFAGFATLPMAEPEAACTEFRRCVKELGFPGTLIDNTSEGRFYDDEFFWPVFQTAEELDVPVYIHPAPNEDTKPLLYDGNYPEAVAMSLSQFVWGWHSETAVHFLRLFAAGLFDRFPKLKIVLGHMGEMLPFQLDRIEAISDRMWPAVGTQLRRSLRQVWDENLWITTSGMFALAPMATVLRQCKHDRIMFSVDYPFGSNERGRQFLEKLKKDGMVRDEVLEDIAYRNAEKLLGIRIKNEL